MGKKVFICYRRADSGWAARAVFEALAKHISTDDIFMDVESIAIGANFVSVVDEWISKCDIALIIIGHQWLDITDPNTGARRLDNPKDYVRVEVRQSLRRGVLVVPVFLDGAAMPPPSSLPEDIRALTHRNGMGLRMRFKDVDLAILVNQLRLPEAPSTASPGIQLRTSGLPTDDFLQESEPAKSLLPRITLARLLFRLFDANPERLRQWATDFAPGLVMSVHWKQGIRPVVHDLEQRLIDRGDVNLRDMWLSLAAHHTDRIDEIWHVAEAYGVDRPIDTRDPVLGIGPREPLLAEAALGDAMAQTRAIVGELRKRPLHGRADTLAALDSWMNQHRGGRMMLRGPAGVGKSAVLAHWGGSLVARNVCVVQHFFDRSYAATTSVPRAYASLLDQLRQAMNRDRARRDEAIPRNALVALLCRDRSATDPLVVILDGVDEADGVIEPFAGCGEYVYVAISTRSLAGQSSANAKRWTVGTESDVPLAPLSIEGLLQWVQAEIPGVQNASEIAQRLHALTKGVPLDARFVLADLVTSGPSNETPHVSNDRLNRLPSGFVEFCREQLRYIHEQIDLSTESPSDAHDWGDFIRRLFALLIYARGPVSETEIGLILGTTKSGFFSELPEVVTRWFVLVPGSGLSFDNQRLAEIFRVAIQEAPGMDVEAAWARDALIEHCRRWADHKASYALLHLPGHLLEIGETQAAQQTLLDLSFLRARVASSQPQLMIRRTIEDCGMLEHERGNSSELDRMFAFWSTHEAVLAAHETSFGHTRLHDIFDQLVVDLNFSSAATAGEWRIQAGRPDTASPSLRRELFGHDGPVEGALELDDGGILSWSRDRTLRKWSADGILVRVLEGHEGSVVGALALPNDQTLSWSHDNTLRMWHSDGDCQVLQGHADWILGARRLSDGRILSWSHDATLGLWNTDGTLQTSLEGHIGSVTGALELRDGQILSWGEEGALRVWASDGRSQVLTGHQDRVSGAIEHKTGEVISWGADGMVWRWNVARGEGRVVHRYPGAISGVRPLGSGDLVSWSFAGEITVLRADGARPTPLTGHEGWISGVRVLPNDSIMSWSYDKSIRWWRSDGRLKAMLLGHSAGVRDVIMLRSRRGFLSWSDDGTLRLWSSDGTATGALTGHVGWRTSGARILSGDRVVSWGRDGTLRLWSTESSRAASDPTRSSDEVRGWAQRSDGALWSWSSTGEVRGWQSDGALAFESPGHERGVSGAFVTRDGRMLTWSADGRIATWSPRGRELSTRFGTAILGLIPLSDGRLLSWSSEPELRVWSPDGRLDRTIATRAADTLGVVPLPGNQLVSWSADHTIRRWSEHGELLGEIEYSTHEIKRAARLKSGEWVSWGDEPQILLWSSDGQMRRLEGHQDGVSQVRELSNGQLLSIGLDRTLRLWTSGGEAAAVFIGHTDRIDGVFEMSDGRLLSWSDDRTARIWRLEAPADALVLEGHTHWVSGAIEVDGHLLSHSEDGTIRLWSKVGVPVSKWVSPGGLGIKSLLTHAKTDGLYWVRTQRDVFLVAHNARSSAP